MPHHPAPGETLTSNSLPISPGGKGANQPSRAPSYRGLGRPRIRTPPPVSLMVGAVGDGDSYGTLLKSTWRAHGVDVEGVDQRQGLKTGVLSSLSMSRTGQNRIVLSPEANHALQPADFASGLGTKIPRSTAGPSHNAA